MFAPGKHATTYAERTMNPAFIELRHNHAILFVEDNPDDTDLTLRALRKAGIPNEVVHVRDGAEALDYLFGAGRHAGRDVKLLPQLILLDLKLSKVDGFEVLRRVRSDSAHADRPRGHPDFVEGGPGPDRSLQPIREQFHSQARGFRPVF
jgi:CheY-like chemotaxis protein